MTDREVIKNLANEYYAEYCAGFWTKGAPTFYDYLLRHGGFKTHQLSRLGIGKSIQADDAQQWRGEQLA